jgi:hypothetical protein
MPPNSNFPRVPVQAEFYRFGNAEEWKLSIEGPAWLIHDLVEKIQAGKVRLNNFGGNGELSNFKHTHFSLRFDEALKPVGLWDWTGIE